MSYEMPRTTRPSARERSQPTPAVATAVAVAPPTSATYRCSAGGEGGSVFVGSGRPTT